MEFHPFANAYPMMAAVEIEAMAGRMSEVGFDRRFPIVRFQGQILDGRNRFQAAEQSGVDPFYVDFAGTEDEARQFVIDAAELRRHLDPGWLSEHRRARLQRITTARQAGHSTRAIAEAEGISQAQVNRDLAQVNPPHGSPDGNGKPKSPPALCVRCARVGIAACPACKEKGAKATPTVKGQDGKTYSTTGKTKGQKRQRKPWTLKDTEARLHAVTRDLDHLNAECAERAGKGDRRFCGHKTAITAALAKHEEVFKAVMAVGRVMESAK